MNRRERKKNHKKKAVVEPERIKEGVSGSGKCNHFYVLVYRLFVSCVVLQYFFDSFLYSSGSSILVQYRFYQLSFVFVSLLLCDVYLDVYTRILYRFFVHNSNAIYPPHRVILYGCIVGDVMRRLDSSSSLALTERRYRFGVRRLASRYMASQWSMIQDRAHQLLVRPLQRQRG